MLCRIKSFEKCNMTPLQLITKSSISHFIYASKDSFQSNNEDIYPLHLQDHHTFVSKVAPRTGLFG